MPLATPWGCQQGSINHGEVPYLVKMACRHRAEGQGCLQPIEPDTKGLAPLFLCLHSSNLIQQSLARYFNTIWYYFWSSAYQASFVITAGRRQSLLPRLQWRKERFLQFCHRNKLKKKGDSYLFYYFRFCYGAFTVRSNYQLRKPGKTTVIVVPSIWRPHNHHHKTKGRSVVWEGVRVWLGGCECWVGLLGFSWCF